MGLPERRGKGAHAVRFGLFGSASAARGAGPDVDSGAGFREFIDNNVEAEASGDVSSFLVEHHFTGFGQVSATLNLLTWLGARTKTLRPDTAEMAEAGALYGTPDEIATRLEALRAAGAEYVLLNTAGGIRSLRRFAREIMPAFTSDLRSDQPTIQAEHASMKG